MTTVTPLRPDDLDTLIAGAPRPCVSVYVANHRYGPEAAHDPRRLRTLIAAADAALCEQGVVGTERETLLAPAVAVGDDPLAWQLYQDGIAVFTAAGVARVMEVPFRVPDVAVVDETFHVLPLVALLERGASDGRVLVLALRRDGARLFDVDRWSITEVTVPDLPDDNATTASGRTPQPALQLRRAMAGPSDAAFIHGHGGSRDAAADQRERHFRAVERAVRPIVAASDAPLAVAGVPSTVAAFRSVATHLDVVGDIALQPERTPRGELRDAALQLLDRRRERERQTALARYRAIAGTGLTSEDAPAIAAAARRGRVERLLVATPTDPHDDDPSLRAAVNDAVVHTLRHRGEMVVVPAAQLPSAVAASLRR